MKRAFSLIELLLAIVIVGIAVSALPFIANSTGKANAQAVVSEVVTSSRIFIDDILSEPWNSAITNGFVNSNGAVLYSGILNAQRGDARFSVGTKKYFSRTLARGRDGTPINAVRVNAVGEGLCDFGINCKNGVHSALRAERRPERKSKNSFNVDIRAQVRFINIAEETDGDGKKITATFNDRAVAADGTTTNAILVSATATGEGESNIIDDVDQIRLNGFAFNIGTESR
ncbi:MAG: type II secretion system GspH family protein [Campylobacter sp.]|uniref:type II secretion system protein n=1 Tax=Campylobacter sp. TaxID=205 RepID=UPI002AA7B153|nr:type II secretion system protein [Campylobacter sp.]MCI7024126.1 type II secretion system GspH family protein [Campylobacter sp.]